MKNNKILFISITTFIIFILWTISLYFIDVMPIGQLDTNIGYATINKNIHNTIGVNIFLYELTDWLSIFPILLVIFFAFLGLKQLIKRKSILRVDSDIILLGIFYIIVFFLYFIFEKFIVNYRPILINNTLEASYPSSTTMLVLCTVPTAIMQLNWHCKKTLLKKIIKYSLIIFLVFMVLCRFLSGVHWFSDIVGGILLSTSLISIYYYLCNKFSKHLC